MSAPAPTSVPVSASAPASAPTSAPTPTTTPARPYSLQLYLLCTQPHPNYLPLSLIPLGFFSLELPPCAQQPLSALSSLSRSLVFILRDLQIRSHSVLLRNFSTFPQ